MDKYLKIDYVWDLEDMIDEENIIEQLDWKDFYFNILDIVLDAPILFGDIYSDNVQKWLPIINDIAKKLGLKKIYHLDSRELYPFGVVDVREQEKKDLMESPYLESYYSISKFMMEIDYYKDASLIIYDNEYKLYEEFDESLLEQILKIYVQGGEKMNYNEVLESKEYDFLRNDPLLKNNILFLTVAGSHAYGTNVETSDLDIRGVVLERETDTLGLTDFEQYIDAKTDTVIYTLKKFLKLVKECNPNIIEMLYSKPEHYLYVSPLGKLLLDNRDLFLTKRAAYSFGGYANAQLNRLENAMARDTLSEHDKLEHINRSVENAAKSFETKFKLPEDAIRTYVGSWYNGSDEEVLVDFKLEHYPLTRLRSMIDEMTDVIRTYNDTVGQRNKKKDDLHLNKHMMHLIRLYFMCNEILEFKTVHTYREKEHELLMDIRNGKYRKADGYVTDEFYLLLNNLKEKCDKLKKETTLNDYVDTDKFNELVLKLYREARK